MNRSGLRKHLLDTRMALSTVERDAQDFFIARHLRAHLLSEAVPRPGKIGGYWPIRNEPNLHALLIELELSGFEIGLPAIVSNDQPLRFLHWHSDRPLVTGPLGIPIPEKSLELVPDILLVPCLGFFIGADGRRFRLGYGGGFYDRTLAARPTPAVGIAYECSRNAAAEAPDPADTHDAAVPIGFTPAAHDVPMTAIVTESGIF